ncbi:MAG TPA: UDP-N-acetylglucosamine 1-carboxyvinyltransferase [Vicinamibacteria bacterium]|nr:UDP-N-acetylglucosamine 1-carboxyvinyltransferase [Vicinamibacteria bacterium]
MDKLRVIGGRRLSGRVRIGGAKNAALPAMAASLLTDDRVHLENLPDVWDVGTMRRLLRDLGSEVEPLAPDEIEIVTRELRSHEAPYELVKTMRASVLVLGPLLARHGKARVSLPGGCAIGARPIDQHIGGLRKLGARVVLEHGFVEASSDGLRGATIRFPRVTVTGTENLLMAATLARGETVLENAAREPEVVDLAELLSAMGARIEGAGSDTVRIEGVSRLGGARHRIVPDRIETGTFLVASALLGDDVVLTRCRPDHLGAVLEALRRAGIPIDSGEDTIRVSSATPRAVEIVTEPYPGFPTDMQAQLTVLFTQAPGRSFVTETIFENRFMHIAELARMGARIQVSGNRASIEGPTVLSGARVMATDLRASACLVLAALVADGESLIDRVYHLDRGYEHIEAKLRSLGAEVERLP